MQNDSARPAQRWIDQDLLHEIRSRLRCSQVIGRFVSLAPCGREHVGLCPFHDDHDPSLTVNDEKGFFHCFPCGAHGDVIEFVRRVEGLHFRAAVEALAIDAGLMPGRGAASRTALPPLPRRDRTGLAREKAAVLSRVRRDLRAARAGANTLLQVYLGSRGITFPPPQALRFAPALAYWEPQADGPPALVGRFPAIIAPVQDVRGDLVGLHRTYLRPDGRGKAAVPSPKKLLGACFGGAVRFAEAAETLALAEGIETALSVAQAMPGLPVWSTLSLGNLAGSGLGRGAPHPRSPNRRLPSVEPDMNRPGIVLPPVVRQLILCADADSGDQDSAMALLERAARRFTRFGVRVRIARPPDGMDFNDVLRAPDAAVAARLSQLSQVSQI